MGLLYLCISACGLSLLPRVTTLLSLDVFSWNLMVFDYFSEICRKSQSFIEIWQEHRVLYMETKVHVQKYCAEFCLEWEIFQTKVVEKNHNIFYIQWRFFRRFQLLWDNVEKYGRYRQATGDNIARRTCFAGWITKAINTHSEYVIFIAFPRQRWSCERL
jgi:hypothetical protein